MLKNIILLVGLLPLWSLFFKKMTDVDTSMIRLPVTEMIVLSSCIVSASLMGVLVARRFPRLYYKLWHLYLPFLALLTLGLIFAVNVYIYHPLFCQTTFKTFLFVVFVSVCGYSSGILVAYLARLTRSQQLSICLETGTRTTYIVSVLLHSSMAEPEDQLACLAPSMCSLLCVSVSTVCVCVYRVMSRRRSSQRLVEAHCQLLETSTEEVFDADHLQRQLRSHYIHTSTLRTAHDRHLATLDCFPSISLLRDSV